MLPGHPDLEETLSQTAVAAAPTTTPGRSSTARGGRDPFFDNAKWLLVTLVVIGHSWTLADENYVNDRLYNWLYLWHLPAFVMVTGYLSRSFTWRRRHLRRLVTTVVLPYFVFEGLLAIFRVTVGGERFDQLWLDPHWPMWYLAALALWRLATPALRRLSWALPLAVAISLLGGTVSAEVADVKRVLGLLPFFTAGLLVQPHHLSWLRRRATRLGGVAVLAAGVPLALLVESHLQTEWLYYRSSYADLEFGWVPGMTMRLLLLATGAAMAVSALAWIPSRTTWYTRLGSASLVVYLFHAFAVKGAEYAGLETWAQGRGWESLVVTTAGAVLVSIALAWRPVARTLDKVVTPDAHVPSRQQAPASSATTGRG
jgi:fucose 4-O-acetylase-like acetyltransferase